MTEAINDLGYMQTILHALFHSADFKCKQYCDPPGALYDALKIYLKDYLHPASFDTYWKCIVAMEPFMDKAFTQMVILRALEIGGFEGCNINARTILGHNLEFCKLSQDESDKVLALVETVFSSYRERNSLIHENIFNEVFDGEENIDTLGDRSGKSLNELTTNSHRFMMDNGKKWMEELKRREEITKAAEETKEAKRLEREAKQSDLPSKSRHCSVIRSCPNIIDISTKEKERQ